MTEGNIALLPLQLFYLVSHFNMCQMGKFGGSVTLLTRKMVESITQKKMSLLKKYHGLYWRQKYCLTISHLEISRVKL